MRDHNILSQSFSFEDTALAVRYRKGSRSPGLVWLCGYRGSMLSDKAIMVDAFAQKNDLSCLRFDYSGHGESKGDFFQGSISRWAKESLAIFEHYCEGPRILIGFSMGGWISIKLAVMLAQKNKALAGLMLIAPAADFTRTLVEPTLSEVEWKLLEEKGYIEQPAIKDNKPMPFSKALIEDGRNSCVMKGYNDVGCPVHILHGMEDNEIPYQNTLTLLDYLPEHDVKVTFIRDADHYLSRPQDLEYLERSLMSFIEQVSVK